MIRELVRLGRALHGAQSAVTPKHGRQLGSTPGAKAGESTGDANADCALNQAEREHAKQIEHGAGLTSLLPFGGKE
ncbi:MAG TPA: hypothetical protein VFQ61_18805 [Polyangiaceae bacterium]|nr:hypothetical protein [Polyangiaceae bacterium]